MFSGLKDWFYWNWSLLFVIIVIIAILVLAGLFFYGIAGNAPPRTEQIKILAVGKLVSIRATGAWNIYDTELKFDDGSMLCVTYSFSRKHNLRVGVRYKIWDSSRWGYRCKLLEQQNK